MQSYCATLTPLSAFATPLKGDTLFGHLCWAIHNRFGEARLIELLQGYTQNAPFAAIADAFPEGFWPLPTLPSGYYRLPEGADRKTVKKRDWLPEAAFAKPVSDWLQCAVNLGEISAKRPQPHTTINRQTNTAGKDGFAPYSIEQEWFIPGLRWSLYLRLDSRRLPPEDCRQCLEDIGNFGFGRDAGIGLGKFAVEAFQARELPAQNSANACLTLAPCAPQGLGYDRQRSFYQPFTRFGRHGDIAVHQQGKAFKNPLLLAQTAAVFGVEPPAKGYIGQGIGGNGQLSLTLPATVHQGYAPVLPVLLDFNREH